MLMKKEVIEDNEKLKKEVKDLKKQLEEEKNAYNRMYNMYVEKDNIINELEKALDENVELTYVRNGKRQYNKHLTEGGLLFRDYIKSKLQELKGSDKE